MALTACVRVQSTARPVAAAEVGPGHGWIAVAGIVPVRQKDALDCGPAALATVARHWGLELSLDQATRGSLRQPGRGARLGTLRDAARARGLTAFAIRADRATLVHELAAGRPVLVGLVRGSGRERSSHFEVVVGHHPGRGEVATIDPAAGFGVRRWRDLFAEWEPAGRPALVVLGPAAAAGARRRPVTAASASR